MEEWIGVRELGRRTARTHTAIQKAIADGRIPARAVRRPETGRIRAVELHAAVQALRENTDPAEALRNGKTLPQTSGLGGNVPGIAERGSTEAGGTAPGAGRADARAATAGQAGVTAGQGQQGERDPQEVKPRDPDGYLEARAKREQFAARQAEVDFLKAIGLLVSVDEMRKVGARRYRGMRDTLLGIADREADRLAAERDPAQVHAILTQAIKQALHELADDAEAESAGGVAERVAA